MDSICWPQSGIIMVKNIQIPYDISTHTHYVGTVQEADVVDHSIAERVFDQKIDPALPGSASHVMTV
jgi:hypothetical protein